MAIIDQINETLSSLPNFTSLANKIEGIVNIADVVVNLRNIINEVDVLMNSVIDIGGLDSINDTFNQITDVFDQVKDQVGSITKPIKDVDGQIASINIQSFYDIIKDNVTVYYTINI